MMIKTWIFHSSESHCQVSRDRAIWIGINECFPVFCWFCNELSSSPANHFSEGSPSLQLFSFIHHSQVLGRLCLLPQVQLMLSHNSTCLHFGPFVNAIHAFSCPQHFHDPHLHRAHSSISFYLPRSPNKITSRSAMIEKERKQSSFNPCTHI